MLSIKEIRKLIVVAVFSVDELFEHGVLKGGNALDLVYDVSPRASFDIDVSLPRDSDSFRELIRVDLKESLNRVFLGNGIEVRGYSVHEPEKQTRPGLGGIGGGYGVSFYLINHESKLKIEYDAVTLTDISANTERKKHPFLIDFSVSEFCELKVDQPIVVEGLEFLIRVYTPEMLVIEKIRALCQSMPDADFKTPLPPRAKDVIDIYVLCEEFQIDLHSVENIGLFKIIFEIKKVPISLVPKIKACREFHRGNFDSVRDTVYPNFGLKNFDFYFDYLQNKLPPLESFGDE